jgi:hypothetical protein
MGMILGKDFNLKILKDLSKGMIIKDEFFNEVPILEQKDLEKWSYSEFNFKFKYEDEWYLATFYNHGGENKVSLSVAKWVNA